MEKPDGNGVSYGGNIACSKKWVCSPRNGELQPKRLVFSHCLGRQVAREMAPRGSQDPSMHGRTSGGQSGRHPEKEMVARGSCSFLGQAGLWPD